MVNSSTHSEGSTTSSVSSNPRGQHCLIRRNHYDLSKRRNVYLRAIFTPLKELVQQDCRLITTRKSLISFLTSCPRLSLIYSVTHLRTDLSKASQRWRNINTIIQEREGTKFQLTCGVTDHCTALNIHSIPLAATAAGEPYRRSKSPFRYICIIQNSSETVLLVNVHYHRSKLYWGNPSIVSKLCNCFQNLVLFTTYFGQPSHLQVIHNIY
jgi:hypothetical protein